ncbi:MAG: pyridoxamine 5'-phosphate oxidase-like FMN-binding protein [Osedax symbiont Rs2]|nr:MAG: pyridoxamine 5'-phosphate oxidase-like FMN-binding protein [Osedax symbiont Rs2]
MKINTEQALRDLYGQPKQRAVQKQLSQLERHSINFLNLSPFAVISSYDNEGKLDCSPRGGEPGFVRVISNTELAIADARGNNRLDSLCNIVQSGQIGCLFMIPGIDETLRINGTAYLSVDPDDLRHSSTDKNPAKSVIRIAITEVFLHCAKSMMRSKLWHPQSLQQRDVLPSMGTMIADQTTTVAPVETQQQMLARYTDQL